MPWSRKSKTLEERPLRLQAMVRYSFSHVLVAWLTLSAVTAVDYPKRVVQGTIQSVPHSLCLRSLLSKL